MGGGSNGWWAGRWRARPLQLCALALALACLGLAYVPIGVFLDPPLRGQLDLLRFPPEMRGLLGPRSSPVSLTAWALALAWHGGGLISLGLTFLLASQPQATDVLHAPRGETTAEELWRSFKAAVLPASLWLLSSAWLAEQALFAADWLLVAPKYALGGAVAMAWLVGIAAYRSLLPAPEVPCRTAPVYVRRRQGRLPEDGLDPMAGAPSFTERAQRAHRDREGAAVGRREGRP